MSKTDRQSPEMEDGAIHREYILGVRIVEVNGDDGPRYRFEAPQHRGVEFADPEMAELYADVYFCANGFEEEGTGEHGIPPAIIAAGRAVLASYMLAQPHNDREWVASFFGMKPHRIHKYAEVVENRAREIRDGAEEQGLE
jgi:hypothetical protein